MSHSIAQSSFSVPSSKHADLTRAVLRQHQAIWLTHSNTTTMGDNIGLALSLAQEWQLYGFSCQKELILGLSHLDSAKLRALHATVSHELAVMVGAHRAFRPLFPNFPSDALTSENAQFATALLRALNHSAYFWLDWSLLPYASQLTSRVERKALNEQHAARQLRVVDVSGLGELLVRFLTMTTPWSAQMRDDVFVHVDALGGVQSLIAFLKHNRVSNRENLAHLGAWIVKSKGDVSCLVPSISSATDVLRIAVALAGGDVNMPPDVKVRIAKVSRGYRKSFLALMECQVDGAAMLENMRARRGLFLALGEMLHPREFEDRYPTVAWVYSALRNPKMKESLYGSRLEKAMARSNIKEALELLVARPGIFARRVVHLLRLSSVQQKQMVLRAFEKVAGVASANVLWQLRTHVQHGMDVAHRVFAVKGSISKVYVRPAQTPLEDGLRLQLISLLDGALADKYSSMPSLGRVYMNPELRNVVIPHGLRNASEGLSTIARGSRIPLFAEGLQGRKSWVRFFMWWKGYVDLDLSVVLLNDEGRIVRQCSWTDLRGSGMVHSGDVRSAPEGACEFIDVDVQQVAKDARYLLMVVNSYSGIDFSELEESFAGWMLRADGGEGLGASRGNAFDARTVAHKMDLTSVSKVAAPMLIDLHREEVVWVDLGLKAMPGYSHYGRYTTENQHSYFEWLIKGVTSMKRATLGELVDIHVHAREGSSFVDSPEEADLIIDWNGKLRPFDHGAWSSAWVGE